MFVPVAEVLPSMVSEGLPSGLRMLLIPESEAVTLEVDLGPDLGSTPEATDVEGSGGSVDAVRIIPRFQNLVERLDSALHTEVLRYRICEHRQQLDHLSASGSYLMHLINEHAYGKTRPVLTHRY